MKKKLSGYVPVICLGAGWSSGLLIFYLCRSFGARLPVFNAEGLVFSNICSAILTQLCFFILSCLFGFSMLSGIVPAALVYVRSTLASLSCAIVYISLVSREGFTLLYCAFTLTSALICVFLTSSARLAHIFYTKVPHTKPENILDYVARQLFTMGFAAAALIIYYTVCAVI